MIAKWVKWVKKLTLNIHKTTKRLKGDTAWLGRDAEWQAETQINTKHLVGRLRAPMGPNPYIVVICANVKTIFAIYNFCTNILEANRPFPLRSVLHLDILF